MSMRSSSLYAVIALMLALPSAARRPAPIVCRTTCPAALVSLADSTFTRRLDYRLLMRALARYRALAADSAIPAFATPVSRMVRPGDSLAMVSQLRARLIALGDLAATAASDSDGRYAEPVVGAVRRFQVRHGLDDDGIIGPLTLAALQFPLALRVPQIERSLERIRRRRWSSSFDISNPGHTGTCRGTFSSRR